MGENDQTTRTPRAEHGDASESTSTTENQPAEGRDAEQSDIAKLNLEWKARAEEANQLKAENAELKERLKQSPAASERREDGTEDEDDLQRTIEFATKGDPVARFALRTRLEAEAKDRERSHEDQIRDMPEAERREVREHFQKNRHRLGDPQAARAELRERKLSAENEKLRAELDKATKRPDTDVVRTHHREVPASEHKVRTMTPDEFDAEQARLAAEGRHRDKMAMQREYAEGKIELKR